VECIYSKWLEQSNESAEIFKNDILSAIDNMNKITAVRDNVMLEMTEEIKDEQNEIRKIFVNLVREITEIKGRLNNINGQVGATLALTNSRVDQGLNFMKETQSTQALIRRDSRYWMKK
jgi:hypothetical protein